MKRKYIKPIIARIFLDNSISLQMQSDPPINPPPVTGGSRKGTNEPFQSPFGDKPFN
jgi:hypothetical protein